MRRLFVAQGSLHLVTALVAGETCTAGGTIPAPPDRDSGDTILLHGLNPDREQSFAWAKVLRDAASGLGTWGSIEFIEPEWLRRLEGKARWRGWRHASEFLTERLRNGGAPPRVSGAGESRTAHSFDEIYIQRNPEWVNHCVLAAYPEAKKVCYGDGLGLNYSDHYWNPREEDRPSAVGRGVIRTTVSRLRERMARGWRATPLDPPRPRFDAHCLLLPNCFDDHIADPVVPDPESFRRIIDAWIPAIETGRGEHPIPVDGASEVLVLVTSCFSEAERIDQAAEVAAYAEMMEELDPNHEALWVVKPHPRDLQEKTTALLRALEERHDRIHLLDDPARRYLPFEVTVRLELTGDHLPPRRYLTFSSACLALEHLYGETTTFGFGEERVRRIFRPEFIGRRLEHERDLRAALDRVRSERQIGPAEQSPTKPAPPKAAPPDAAPREAAPEQVTPEREGERS